MSAPLSATEAVLLVARREFVTQVRSRSFVIGLVITLALFGGIFALAAYISGQASAKYVGLTAGAGPLRPALEHAALVQDVELEFRVVDDRGGRELVGSGELDALLTTTGAGFELLGRTRSTASCRRSSARRSSRTRSPRRSTEQASTRRGSPRSRSWPSPPWSPPTPTPSSSWRSPSSGRSCCSSR